MEENLSRLEYERGDMLLGRGKTLIKKIEIWEEIKFLKAGMPTMRGGVASQVTQRQLRKS